MISMIAAVSENRVIWKENKLPRHYPEDLKHFKKLTLNKPIVMWRKTFESIGRPLPKRENIVLTRNASWEHSWVTICKDFMKLIDTYMAINSELMVIGGQQIYELFLPYATTLYLTEVKKTIDWDTFFPLYDHYCELERTTPHDEYDFVTYTNFTSA